MGFLGVSEFQVIAGLYQKAFHHLSSAVHAAEEGSQPSGGPGPTTRVVDAYMTLVDFCDQQLRKVEDNAAGESQKKETS